MGKMKFFILVLMMLLSIVGIIWVQIIWINNAVSIRNESFNNFVIIGLNNAANSIESARKMNFFNNFLLEDAISLNDTSSEISGYMRVESYSSVGGSMKIHNQTYTGNADTGKMTMSSVTIDGDTAIISDSVSFVVTSPDPGGKMKIIKSTENIKDDSSSIYIRQNEFLHWLKRRSREFRNLSDQMISEIYQWEKTLEFDINEIDLALKRAFAGINTPYEYAVIRNGIVQEGTFARSRKEDFLKTKYMVRLFPDNLVQQDIILSVIFPKQSNYVLGSMGWILSGSMVFSLFILATFALSLFMILRQKKISEMKSDFLNNMTHEFKTPIATISLAADTITNPKIINDEKNIRHFIGMIKKENSRMNKKVETILQIASLDKKEIQFNFEKTSLHEIIRHAVETIEIQVQQRFGRIILHLDARNEEINGDADHLVNLVNNLLDNAIKYSPGSPEITIITKDTEKGVLMTVEDKGIGMNKAVQGKIFERFYRQSSGNIHDVKGFGLGLNYAKAIIDAHKGNVSVTSEPGKGSAFKVFLPH
jgi:two-component system, OmpR family, phosphate regulon sensor histidine kinase PhoR